MTEEPVETMILSHRFPDLIQFCVQLNRSFGYNGVREYMDLAKYILGGICIDAY